MKTNKILCLLLGLSLLGSSCQDELNIKSEASLDATTPLSTEDVNKLLTGVYNRMMEPSGYAYFNIMTTEIMSDNYRPIKFQWFQVQNLYEHNVPADDILLSYGYFGYFRAIERIHTIMKVPSASTTQVAMARYCRALSYLRLYDCFERVPLVDENYDNKPIAPSSKDAVLDFIVKDLEFAMANCPVFDEKNAEVSQCTPTQEGAKALLARVYRLQGDIASAGIIAEQLITSGKFPLSSNPSEYRGETIMRFAGNKAEENGSWGWIMSPQAATWNCFAAADELVALVKGDDTRASLFEYNTQHGAYFSTKYTTNDDSDLLVSRIAEMYLISAEAGNANRLTEFQNVRKSSLTLDQERRLELSFEWVRWEDMKLAGETYVLPYPQRAVDSNPLLKN